MPEIHRLNADEARAAFPQLVSLLQDAVDDGASIGFLRPLDPRIAESFWDEVIRDVRQGSRVLLVATSGTTIVGSVQLGLCLRPNGMHRAEVQKLLVHTAWRRQGIARDLMQAVEQEARSAHRSLLYLDTEPNKPAEWMYQQLGWIRAGEIPEYACTPDGQLHSTILYYRKI